MTANPVLDSSTSFRNLMSFQVQAVCASRSFDNIIPMQDRGVCDDRASPEADTKDASESYV